MEYQGYLIYPCGLVKNKYGKVMKPKYQDGYHRVALYHNKKRKYHMVHRLVGYCYLSNPNNLPQIDHINRIRNDNRVENLRWVDAKEQANNRKPRKKKI